MAKKEKNIWELKKDIGERLQTSSEVPWSEKFIKQYKSVLFRTMLAATEYQQARKEYLKLSKAEREQQKIFREAFHAAKESNHFLDEDEFRKIYDWKK